MEAIRRCYRQLHRIRNAESGRFSRSLWNRTDWVVILAIVGRMTRVHNTDMFVCEISLSTKEALMPWY